MSKNPFRSKIKCKKCGKNYMRKVEKGVVKFICSGYHNKNGCKERNVITEDFIMGLINKRLETKISDEELIKIISHINIDGNILLEIHFTDNSIPIILKGNFIQY